MNHSPKYKYKIAKILSQNPSDFSLSDYHILVKELNWHSYLYHTQDSPQITDHEYDSMMNLLKKIEEDHSDWRGADSPSLKVGGEIKEEFAKVTHKPPMLSLDNADTWEDMLNFNDRVQKNLEISGKRLTYHCEPKFDGLAVELEYMNGVLKTGSTRGNGIVGEDITHNIRTLKNIPLSLLSEFPPRRILIRGECILPLSEFEKINQQIEQEGGKLYANPRNLAAGTLRQQDSALVAQKNIKFFPYYVGEVEETQESLRKNPFPEKQEQIYNEYLSSLGFQISKYTKLCQLEEIHSFYEKMQLKRSEIGFDTDGLVVKVNHLSYWPKLGHTSKAPRHSIAFKFPPGNGITRVIKVSFQIGRTGVVTPVAHLQPVNIGGVIVKKASLHNKNEMERLKIGKNDLVEVQRAGDVIPKVVQVKEKAVSKRLFSFPTKCPSCGHKLIKEEVYIRCVFPSCKQKNISLLQFMVSRSGLDIRGIGAEWIAVFYELGLVKNMADLYALKIEDISNISGMGPILPGKIIESINKKRRVDFYIFLRALGIPLVGDHIAQVLADHFQTIERLKNASLEELNSIYEIGPSTGEAIIEYFKDASNQKMLKKLFNNKFYLSFTKKKIQNDQFRDKSFVFTGILSKMSRNQAQQEVKKRGGAVSSSVSKKTNFVVVGSSPGSKHDKAEKLGITILNEKKFLDLLK